MKNIKISVILAIVAGLALPSCGIDEPAMEPGTFEIDQQYLIDYNFYQSQTTTFIPVRTNIPAYEWECRSDGDWCKLAASYTKDVGLILAVPESEEPEVRSTTAYVTAGGKTYEFKVSQLGYGPAILVSDLSIPAAGGSVRINVVSNIEYKDSAPEIDEEDVVQGEDPWFRKDDTQTSTKAFASDIINYVAHSNGNPYQRKATITFTPTAEEYKDRTKTITVTQGTVNISPVGTDRGDNRVSPREVTANQQHSDSYKIDYICDQKWASSYQSPWGTNDSDPQTQWPVVIEFTFNQLQNIDYFLLTNARHNDSSEETAGALTDIQGHGGGRPGLLKVYVKTESAGEYSQEPILTHDFEGQGGREIKLNFTSTLVKPVALKFEFERHEQVKYLSLAEVSFWSSSANEMAEALDKVFTDKSCSALKPTATRDDITALFCYSPYLAQYAAAAMMQGTYPESEREFRVAEYEAYSDASVNQRAVTRIYTSMDNPTGIYVGEGDQIMVCVDRIPAGHEVAIATYGDSGNEPAYGGGNVAESIAQKYPLEEGVNSYVSTAEGMLYVLNTAEKLTAVSPSIKVHILPGCGKVQGYFDLENDKDKEGRFRSLIMSCTYKYFILKGKKIMFNLHTSELRNYTQEQIVSGIEAWDDIVSWQHELMGIDKLTWYNNHMMAISTTAEGSYMDAANRRVRFATSTLNRIIDKEVLLSSEDNAWGPAHELGHCNQFAINWRGASESSNNLFSNYSHYRFGKYPSRGSKLSELAYSWTQKQNFELLGEGDYKTEDTNLHMRMNWQLWTYFHLAEKDTDFWPNLFALLRVDLIPNGEISKEKEDIAAGMMLYVKKACEAAQLDLTEFFETWGFFVPVDVMIDQYGTSRCTITEDMVRAVKAEIAAMNLEKAPPIQYIEDRRAVGTERYCDYGYYEIFKNESKITGTPSCSVNGRKFQTSGCTNAVAIELRKPAAEGAELGDLVYFSNMAEFVVPDTVEDKDLEGIRVYAVQYDGQRISAN